MDFKFPPLGRKAEELDDFTFIEFPSDSTEQFTDTIWDDGGLPTWNMESGLYEFGYHIHTNLRISGSAINKAGNSIVAIESTDAVHQIPRTYTSHAGWFQSNSDNVQCSHVIYLPRLTIPTQKDYRIIFAKDEDPAGGGIGIKVLGGSVGFDGKTFNTVTYVFFKKIANL